MCPGGLAAGILLRVQGGLLVSDALVCIMGLVLLSTGYGPLARLIEVRLCLRPHCYPLCSHPDPLAAWQLVTCRVSLVLTPPSPHRCLLALT